MQSRTEDIDMEDVFQMKFIQLMKGILRYFYRQAVQKKTAQIPSHFYHHSYEKALRLVKCICNSTVVYELSLSSG